MEHLSAQNLDWNVYKKIAFRFVFILFILFIIVENNGAYPFWSQTVGKLLQIPLQKIIPWIGKHVFHIPYYIIVNDTGAGDTTYNYLIVFSIAVVAVLGTIIWSAFDNRRANYETLYYWLTTVVRFYIALMLFSYAMWKIIQLQFPSANMYKLTESFGNMSPFDLAWTYLGFSYGYNVFMGVAEMAALLLLFRRTMTIGAIITLMTTANVMIVNYCFDISVKIISTALVVMTLFLLLNDIDRLFKFFFAGKATSVAIIKAPVFKKRWMSISKIVFKVLIISCGIVVIIINTRKYEKHHYEANNKKSKVFGVYDVATFIVNNDTLSQENPSRWNQLVIGPDGPNNIDAVRYKGDSIGWIPRMDLDNNVIYLSSKNMAHLTMVADSLSMSGKSDDEIGPILASQQLIYVLRYQLSEPDILNLSGRINNDSVFIITKRRPLDIKNFRVMKRGFHWINETDYVY